MAISTESAAVLINTCFPVKCKECGKTTWAVSVGFRIVAGGQIRSFESRSTAYPFLRFFSSSVPEFDVELYFFVDRVVASMLAR